MDILVKSAARPSKENFVYNDTQKNKEERYWVMLKKYENKLYSNK